MKHMISAVTLPATAVPGRDLGKIQKIIPYLLMLLASCLFALGSFAQPEGSLPDPNNTYGEGSRVRTTQTTNPDTFIPETKTEYFDKNGVLREETIKTKNYEGNTVFTRKKYDKTGLPLNRYQAIRDAINAPVLEEELEYDDMGRIKKGKRTVWVNGKWIDFDFDPKKQEYKPAVSYGYADPVTPKEKPACNCSKTELKLGYSYMQMANASTAGRFTTGAELSLQQKLGNHLGLLLDVNGHQQKQNVQTLNRLALMAGVQYNFNKCDDDDNLSVFSRVSIGIMMENKRIKSVSNSANAPSGMVGLGADIKIFRKMALYLSADWVPTYFNKMLQSNFQAGAGLAFRFGSR